VRVEFERPRSLRRWQHQRERGSGPHIQLLRVRSCNVCFLTSYAPDIRVEEQQTKMQTQSRSNANAAAATTRIFPVSTIPREVIVRYATKKRLVVSEADRLFVELEEFLSRAVESPVVPTKEVDDAWHEFILHTRLYSQYCYDKFGRFVHHVPTSPLSSVLSRDTTADSPQVGDLADCSTGDESGCSSDCAPDTGCKSGE
jgi:hypothetical protein